MPLLQINKWKAFKLVYGIQIKDPTPWNAAKVEIHLGDNKNTKPTKTVYIYRMCAASVLSIGGLIHDRGNRSRMLVYGILLLAHYRVFVWSKCTVLCTGSTSGPCGGENSSTSSSGLAHWHLQLQSQKLQSHEQVPKPEALALTPQIMQKRKLPPLFHLRPCSKRTPLSRIVHLYLGGSKGAGSRTSQTVAGSVNFGLGVL